MNKILITGGAGYIGSILTHKLLQNPKNFVTVVDRLDFGLDSISILLNNNNFKIIKSDIRSLSNYLIDLQQADCIVHLAGLVGFPICDANPYEAKSINVQATQNIVNASKSIQKFIFASTGSVYGMMDKICSEIHLPRPTTLYGKSKLEGENIVKKIQGTSLRFATVCGVSYRMRDDLLINNFCKQAAQDNCITLFEENFYRTVIDVSDAVNSIIYAMNNWNNFKNEVFNVGDEKNNFTKREVAEMIKKKKESITLFSSNYSSDPDLRNYKVDYSKLYLTKFKSDIQISHSVNVLLNYYSKKLK
jgi:nucleoside-diphosphate-sugar epimerase